MQTNYIPKETITKKIMESNITLQVSDTINNKIKYICSKIPNNEWIGFIFYEILEGSLDDVPNLKLDLKYLVPLSIGHSASVMTKLSQDGEKLMKVYDHNPELENYRRGLIHSHCNMGVFYSGTDDSEIEDNSPLYDMYLSIVVNNYNDVCAKIGIMGEQEITYNIKQTIVEKMRNSLGEWMPRTSTNNDKGVKTEKILYTYEVSIIKEKLEERDLFIVTAVDNLLKEKTEVGFQYTNKNKFNDGWEFTGNGWEQSGNVWNKYKDVTQGVLPFHSKPSEVNDDFPSEKNIKDFLSYLLNQTNGISLEYTLKKLSDFSERAQDVYLTGRIKGQLFNLLTDFCTQHNIELNYEEAFDFVDIHCIEYLDHLSENKKYESISQILIDVLDVELKRTKEELSLANNTFDLLD